jgi:hypothetical protein
MAPYGLHDVGKEVSLFPWRKITGVRAPNYSIQRYSEHRWLTDCSRCVTDASGEWTDSVAPAACYRVIPYNLDGVPGPASNPAGVGCPQDRRTPS